MIWFLALLKKIPLQVWLLIGGVLLFFGYGQWQYHNGKHHVQVKWDASIERGKTIVADLEAKANRVNTKIVTKYVDRVRVIHEKGDTIVKKIPIYIPTTTPDLPGGFRLLHDAAATAQVPSEASLPGQPVSVRAATETITTNYQRCLVWRAELDAWDQWYAEQLLVWQSAQRK